MGNLVNDNTLNDYLIEIENLIKKIHNLEEAIGGNFVGLGENDCITSLENIVCKYESIKQKIIEGYSVDRKE